jgi:hypothetical protein
MEASSIALDSRPRGVRGRLLDIENIRTLHIPLTRIASAVSLVSVITSMPPSTSIGEPTSDLICARASTCAVSSCCADEVPPDDEDDDVPPDDEDDDEDDDDIPVEFPAE